MKNFHDTKANDIQVRLLSEIPEGLPQVKVSDNKRSVYKQIQAEFSFLR